MFIFAYVLCTYFYAISMVEDPGYVPKPASRIHQKSIVDELLALWKYDEQNYCVYCMTRMPLRAKHCKRCARCVAKHDQYVVFRNLALLLRSFSHCPWIHNCVGANNLRHFFLYVITLEIGILFFVFLTWKRMCPKSTGRYSLLTLQIWKTFLCLQIFSATCFQRHFVASSCETRTLWFLRSGQAYSLFG